MGGTEERVSHVDLAAAVARRQPVANPSLAALTARELALRGRLEGCVTQAPAARRRGGARRTARRQGAVLVANLGAAGRFEAGGKAAERGWL